jgi:hypothetical protein
MSHGIYRLELVKNGKNSDNGTSGTLTLFKGSAVVEQSSVFTGGHPGPGLVPIPDETYTIRLDIRGVAAKADIAPQNTLRPFYGIQEIPAVIDGKNARWEWGTIRAALNEPRQGMPQAYRGNYLHGKQRPGDYTHGCICERTEKILQFLKSIDYKHQSHVSVIVKSK